MRKNKKALIFMGLIVALMLCVCLAACGGGDYIEKNAKKLSAYTIEAGVFDRAKNFLGGGHGFRFLQQHGQQLYRVEVSFVPQRIQKGCVSARSGRADALEGL